VEEIQIWMLSEKLEKASYMHLLKNAFIIIENSKRGLLFDFP
jgi:hypothetical protein